MTTVVAEDSRLSVRALDMAPAIEGAMRALLGCQQDDGHWVFELEADATIPAEYVLLRHYRGEPRNADVEQKIASYLRRVQGKHGGWPLYHQGEFDMSASIKAYFALKMIGDTPDAAHMRRAREAILARGGAVNCNVFTRYWIAHLRPQLSRLKLAGSDWRYQVLVFIQEEQIEWFREKIGSPNDVTVLSLEQAIQHWQWNPKVWTPHFSFRADALKRASQ